MDVNQSDLTHEITIYPLQNSNVLLNVFQKEGINCVYQNISSYNCTLWTMSFTDKLLWFLTLHMVYSVMISA